MLAFAKMNHLDENQIGRRNERFFEAYLLNEFFVHSAADLSLLIWNPDIFQTAYLLRCGPIEILLGGVEFAVLNRGSLPRPSVLLKSYERR
jgi:hypothetical protein